MVAEGIGCVNQESGNDTTFAGWPRLLQLAKKDGRLCTGHLSMRAFADNSPKRHVAVETNLQVMS